VSTVAQATILSKTEKVLVSTLRHSNIFNLVSFFEDHTMAETSLLAPLEQLRDLINTSIDVLQKNEKELQETPFSSIALELHPVHQSTNIEVRKALKTIASSSQMLRALTDPHTFLNDIFMGVRQNLKPRVFPVLTRHLVS
jgi:hypothetical protein